MEEDRDFRGGGAIRPGGEHFFSISRHCPPPSSPRMAARTHHSARGHRQETGYPQLIPASFALSLAARRCDSYAAAMARPCFKIERDFPEPLAGVDEAGCAPLAGPVVAAAVVLDRSRFPRGIDDSKALPAAEREAICS